MSRTGMTFEEARDYVVPFGKFRGKTVDQAALTDQGLLWLDWARGIARQPFREALDVYLEDEAIAADLRPLLRTVGKR